MSDLSRKFILTPKQAAKAIDLFQKNNIRGSSKAIEELTEVTVIHPKSQSKLVYTIIKLVKSL